MPFAFIDFDLLEKNARSIIERAGTKRIRVASKSIRSVEILRRILALDARFQGIMCFSVPEALYLSQQGFDDLLLGYPCWHPDEVRAVCGCIRSGKLITLMMDSPEHVHHLGAIAREEGVILPLCIDIDMSSDFPGLHFGVRRSGIRTAEQALALYEMVKSFPSLQLNGLMGYEAQIAGVGDKLPGNPLKSALIQKLKNRSIKELAERRARTVKALKVAGATLRFVNGGGTGSLESTRLEECVTEVTAGSGFYSPALFDNYRNFRHFPAAGFALEITRSPVAGIYTCHGGGYIASGATGQDKQPQPYLPVGVTLTPLEGAGEVQTPIHYRGKIKLSPGDPVFFRHAKAGELCERFNTILLVSQGQVVEEVKTYRGDGKCFL
jgi:D-serine deaminase-like pyridoxal phosphate-dependent protein